jgi:REP element-mobilizing transposase RayT
MPQSLARILVHLVFSTKNRASIIPNWLEKDLHDFLAGTLRDLGCVSLRVGGMADHVHLLFGLGRIHSIAMVVEEVKKLSSKWVKEKAPDAPDFYWQKGYGAFSVSPSHAEAVEEYIRNQKGRHGVVSFQDEFRTLLTKNGVEFDERYVWD